MFKSYLKIAIRNLQKQKGFAFINIFGVAIGISCFSLLILLINETTMRALGWEVGNAVGKTIKGFQAGTALVMGVVQNFNYRPLGEPVRNQIFITNADKGFVNFYLRLRPEIRMLMHRWLADYANRIGISWLVFVAVGVFTALLAMAAISHQAIRAAMANPVKALKSE